MTRREEKKNSFFVILYMTLDKIIIVQYMRRDCFFLEMGCSRCITQKEMKHQSTAGIRRK